MGFIVLKKEVMLSHPVLCRENWQSNRMLVWNQVLEFQIAKKHIKMLRITILLD